MITGNILLEHGWPQGPLIGIAIDVAEQLIEGGASHDEVLATLENVRIAPDVFADETHLLHPLAQAWKQHTTRSTEQTVREAPLDAPIWGREIIDQQAIDQLQNAMRLPVTVAGALMPDAHVGYGIPIGGVVALENAVAPYMVGVDIACFTGDTKVPTLNGKAYSLQELKELTDAGEKFGVWSCKPDGKVVAAMATAMKTRTNAELVEVQLDNGETIGCTPDHEFMLRDGSYCPAKHLKAGSALMPLYSEVDKEGYLRVQQNYSGRMQKAHWIVARSGLLGEIPRFEGQRTIIHHRNFIENDNSPENLQFMGNNDHSKYHRQLVDRNQHWHSQKFEEARKLALARKAASPEGYAYYAERGSRNLKSYWESDYERAKANCAGNGQRGRQYLIARNQSKEGRAKSKEIASRLYACEICGEQVRSGLGLHNHRRWKHGYNHTVVSVCPLNVKADVYCLNVPEYHNFALAAGVFVHNCRMMMSIYPADLNDVFDNNAKRDQIKRYMRDETRFGIGSQFDRYSRRQHDVMDDDDWSATRLLGHLKDKGAAQLGTSGSGNHFVDAGLLRVDARGASLLGIEPGTYLAFMSHSGSRGVGANIADHYSKLAQKITKLPDKLRHLAWLPLDTEEGEEYWLSMNLAGKYASACHHTIHKALAKRLGEKPIAQVENHHNFCWRENWDGREVYVHRKGATPAHEGVLGIIPGSQGHNSYIVRGLGSERSINSASHGAGRVMSRKQAKQTIPKKERDEWLKRKGVELMGGGMDESPQVYKDINEVLALQTDLVEPIATFQPKIVLMSDDGKSED